MLLWFRRKYEHNQRSCRTGCPFNPWLGVGAFKQAQMNEFKTPPPALGIGIVVRPITLYIIREDLLAIWIWKAVQDEKAGFF
jgi:hypothetical protein